MPSERPVATVTDLGKSIFPTFQVNVPMPSNVPPPPPAPVSTVPATPAPGNSK